MALRTPRSHKVPEWLGGQACVIESLVQFRELSLGVVATSIGSGRRPGVCYEGWHRVRWWKIGLRWAMMGRRSNKVSRKVGQTLRLLQTSDVLSGVPADTIGLGTSPASIFLAAYPPLLSHRPRASQSSSGWPYIWPYIWPQ